MLQYNFNFTSDPYFWIVYKFGSSKPTPFEQNTQLHMPWKISPHAADRNAWSKQ